MFSSPVAYKLLYPETPALSKIQTFAPSLSIKFPSARRIQKIVLPLIVILSLSFLPYGGIPLHLFNIPEAMTFSLPALLGSSNVYMGLLISKKEKRKRQLLNMIQSFFPHGDRLKELSYNDYMECLSLIEPNALDPRPKRTSFEPKYIDPEYYIDFELGREQSSISDLGFKEPPFGRVGFINGVLNNDFHAANAARYLSYLSGGYNVHFVHNASHGLRSDLQECLLGLENPPKMTTPVCLLHEMWDEFFKNEGKDNDQIFLQICHSQGAIHTKNALQDYPESLRKRIRVIAIAPGAYIPEGRCQSTVHYISADPVPAYDTEGQKKASKVFYCETTNPENHMFYNRIYLLPLMQHLSEFTGENLEEALKTRLQLK